MTLQQSFNHLYQPYVTAGRNIAAFAIATYETLTSDRAKEVYKTTWLLAQLCFWLSVLAMRFTIKLGQQFRKYYEAEWAQDANRLADWLLTYPNRCIIPEQTEHPTPKTQAQVTLDDGLTATPEDNIQAIPEPVQVILDSDRTTTHKLREIATHYSVQWRNARGKGKHLKNPDIRQALSAYPEILARLTPDDRHDKELTSGEPS